MRTGTRGPYPARGDGCRAAWVSGARRAPASGRGRRRRRCTASPPPRAGRAPGALAPARRPGRARGRAAGPGAARPSGWNRASRAPGRQTRASSASPAAGSGRCESSPAARTASSAPVASGSASTSASTSAATRSRPSRRASVSICGVRSTATTRPAGPTAARSAGQRPARAARGVEHRTTRRWSQLGDRAGVGRTVVGEPVLPAGGPRPEEPAGVRPVRRCRSVHGAHSLPGGPPRGSPHPRALHTGGCRARAPGRTTRTRMSGRAAGGDLRQCPRRRCPPPWSPCSPWPSRAASPGGSARSGVDPSG